MEQSIPDLIYVQSSEGQPLMPTRKHNKVWYWLRTGRAHLVLRQPFTIQLHFATTNYIQPATVGVDTGSQAVGIAAITNGEVICQAEVHHGKAHLGGNPRETTTVNPSSAGIDHSQRGSALFFMDIYTISLCLGAFGILGTAALLTGVGLVAWHYRGSRMGSFRWRWRNWRLKQLSALACLFFLAMAASFGILHEVWGWLYVLGAFKAGTWWLRRVINQRI